MELSKILSIMQRFVSKDPAKFPINLVNRNEAESVLEATDGYMLARVYVAGTDHTMPNIPGYPNCNKIILPILKSFDRILLDRKEIKELVKHCNAAITLSKDFKPDLSDYCKFDKVKSKKTALIEFRPLFASRPMISAVTIVNVNYETASKYKANLKSKESKQYFENRLFLDEKKVFSNDFVFNAEKLKICLNAALKLSNSDTFTLYHRSEVQPLMITSDSLQVMIMPIKP